MSSNGRKKDVPQNGKKTGFRGPSPDVGKATQFKPGNPGGGRPKRRLLDELYEELLLADNSQEAKKIALVMLKKARRGDLRVVQYVNERTQGMPKQSHKHTGADDGPIRMIVRHVADEGAPE